MIFLLSLVLAALLIWGCAKPLKQHPAPFYLAAAVISLAVLGCTMGGVSFPAWFQDWVWPIFSRSAFATALWVIVMWTGALPNSSKLIKRLMPIRGELSIIACILTLGHNAVYGMTYFRFLFTRPGRLPAGQLAAAVCSLVMICIMLPLFVTSFKAVRKKMKAAGWKKLQRLAYGFYALLYLHIMLLTVPYVLAGRNGYLLNALAYSAVFLGYALCRVLKTRAVQTRRTDGLLRLQRASMAGALAVSLCLTGVLWSAGASNANQTADVPEQEETRQETQEMGTAPEQDDVLETEPAILSDLPGGEEAGEPADPDETEGPVQAADEQEETSQPSEPEQTGEPAASETPEPSEVPAVQSESPSQQTASDPTPPPAPDPTPEPTPAPTPAPTPEPMPEPVRTYKNGTFSGSGEGFAGTITVSVTIKDDVITGITVTASSDDEPYWSDGKTVINRILSAQSANVDTVSGATFSSGGIIEAVKAALASAKN